MIKKTKAQMEIMGIAIVVVLMLVGLALVVAFVILREPSDLREEFIQSQLASNTVGAFLKTTVPNCTEQLDDLLIDCAGGSFIKCDDGSNSCVWVNRSLDIIFNKTLNEFGTRFYFEVNKGLNISTNLPLIVVSRASEGIRSGCIDNRTNTRLGREQATYILPTTFGKDLNILLQICS